MTYRLQYKVKSVKSINPCISVVQTIYDIVKAHGGEIKVETEEREGLPADLSVRKEVKAEASAQAGSTFIIQLPMKENA